jgi:arylsulfatase A-like enzyme
MLASILSWALLFGAAARPNVILIVADDLGAMDVGCNNPKTFYETPRIDGLAQSGMRFTQGYAACPVCSPTRASLMTGKSPPRTGVTDYIGGNRPGPLLPAPNQDHLAQDEVTLAERLRDAGYATFFAGKWHLGTGEFSPNAQGFGPGLTGNGQFYYPPADGASRSHGDGRKDPADPKTTDRIANDAVRFIENHKDGPFFAYHPFLAVHTPIEARRDLVAKYEQKRKSAPADAWGREGERKVRLVQNHAVYAAMLEQMDAAVGRVLDAVEQAGLAERTIVIFTSDNGGLSTSEGHPTSNLPLRAGKGWLYEGGLRVPFIIRAPGVARPGSVCQEPIVSTDLYPTILQLAGLPLSPKQHVDGVSIVPLLRGESFSHGPIFWHYPHYGNQGGAPGGAVRDGEWKLVEWYEDGRLELFHLPGDGKETTNLASKEQDRAAKLRTTLDRWRTDVGAKMPSSNPDWTGESPTKKKKR